MKQLPQKITARPVLLGRLLGAKPLILEVNKNGLNISQNNIKLTVLFEDISDNICLDEGLIFNNVSFSDNKKKLIAKWLSSDNAKEAFQLAISSYFQVIADDISKLQSRIKDLVSTRYPRKKFWLSITEECRLWHNRFKDLPQDGIVTPDQYKAFEYVIFIATSNTSYLSTLQNDYVTRQLDKFKIYFDKVENNPLTDNQRLACVVDEENNLVLAGAGTGKTSVMIGRAGFLIRSKQAAPDEVLMLAFARKAADEMESRISEKLGVTNITTSTFHSLGQYIVSQAENGKPSLSVLAEDNKAFRYFVEECFQELMQDKKYKETAIIYFIQYLNEDVDPFNYENIGDYTQVLIDNDIRTLKDERVKSYQESVIANYLFKQGVLVKSNRTLSLENFHS